jgi:putative DNA primase/helicase
MDGSDRPLPYRWSELRSWSQTLPVVIAQGKAQADRLIALKFCATFIPGPCDLAVARCFERRDVVFLVDADATRRARVAEIARALTDAAKIRVLELPGGVGAWLANGGTPDELDRLVSEAPNFEPDPASAAKTNGADVGDENAAHPPAYSDDGLALRFSARYAASSRFVAAWGRWLFWDETRWKPDETLRSFSLARLICRTASAEITNPKKADDVASAKTVAAVVTLARADRCHAATVEQWDLQPMEFNAPWTVDLKTGEGRPPRREDYCTKIAAVRPGGECPRWRQFLAEITDGAAELQAYLQRMAGYSLTGITTEQVLFFAHGTGSNGKSVFVNTLAAIWGDYAAVAPMESFMASTMSQHPTDLAMLRGVRLVVATEIEKGRRWAESRVKMMTGGERITARFMRQDFFTYTPQFKLLISGNNKPGLRGVDQAIRRRIHLIPFTVTIPPEKRDLELFEKLKPEWPGILQWAVEGCLEWQRIGLDPPAAVRAATEAYLASEDSFANWLDDCCDTSDPESRCNRTALWRSWKSWAENAGDLPGRSTDFYEVLERRGLRFSPLRGDRMFRGICLKSTVTLI